MATQFKHLDIGDHFYDSLNGHLSHVWTKIGHTRARSIHDTTAPFAPNELVILPHEYEANKIWKPTK